MAGITLQQRDLAETREQLRGWFAHRFGTDLAVSELQAANRASGWSSETLAFSVDGAGDCGPAGEYVIRIPPAGGGLFPEYDLAGQTHTQELLRPRGVATPSPIYYEGDSSWLGSAFMVMPRIVGRTPPDMTYNIRGWLHDAGPEVQRRLHDSFLDILATLQRIPEQDVPWLRRPTGVGVGPEIIWWREYLAWSTDNDVPALMTQAFDWLERNQPEDPGPLGLSWGDARLSNTIFDDTGTIVGVLDWEQACICPAEADFGWWLATRRQTLEVQGLTADPELPGFDSRERVIARYQEMIGRPLRDLEFYEMFSMIRMACCIVRIQVLLRNLGQHEHGFMRAPLLPRWAVEALRS
ncbi:phosphotransferase family protein [Mycobacterium sp. OTB74]|jgi:aminoglycoside phosphotransferase (APT) family kinase protein|uniref:phosphotransferase family protein n=1 Tax=Mycobacterium sp. OTB74 TaxID=1853452 RepID=UPI0024730DA5|nr:phosphotransferase family protein [Mycobacterium sp. OTB74]MDH6246746.1 aminoglycoside phosphotransferase (APT) family kinase protein [Mycobacterium sp. OTB74]